MSSSSKLDLHSGLPYWLVLNGLLGDYPPLMQSLSNEEIVIIGSGISGAFVAHELCSAGFRCTMLDRRLLSSGSTWASTAHINYEIDTDLTKLRKLYGEPFAVQVYQSSIEAVQRVGEVLHNTGVNAAYESKASLYLSSDKKGAKAIKAEYLLRRQYGFPAEILDKEALLSAYGIDRINAIWHNNAAQLDSYRAAVGIIKYHVNSGALQVYTRTEVTKMRCVKDGVELITRRGYRVKGRHVVCAPGYELEQFLPRPVMNINSTYALATQPLSDEMLWKDKVLIWETARPYFYLRSTAENRILMGGGDEPFRDELRRDALMRKKKEMLLEQCAALFPQLNGIAADFTWCGSFGETKDGLPYIGEYPGMKGISFALGYGGNGTTFSLIAAEIIRNTLLGRKDDRAALFGFRRS
jgi:glycine/D-amino acid oxidase-like deaminating enzyme